MMITPCATRRSPAGFLLIRRGVVVVVTTLDNNNEKQQASSSFLYVRLSSALPCSALLSTTADGKEKCCRQKTLGLVPTLIFFSSSFFLLDELICSL